MERSSNIELLRIIAMLLILILHANSLSNGLAFCSILLDKVRIFFWNKLVK